MGHTLWTWCLGRVRKEKCSVTSGSFILLFCIFTRGTYVSPAIVHLNVGMYLLLGCPSRSLAGKLVHSSFRLGYKPRRAGPARRPPPRTRHLPLLSAPSLSRRRPRPVSPPLFGPPFPRPRGGGGGWGGGGEGEKERTFPSVPGARGGAASLRSPFTTTCGCAARLTAAPRGSRGGHCGDGAGLGVLGSVVQCGASVRDGPGMRLPGQGSGLGGPPCGRGRGPRSAPRGALRLRLRLVAAARPPDTGESAPSAAGAPARGPRRGIASCCSCWGRLAAAFTASPRIRSLLCPPFPPQCKQAP